MGFLLGGFATGFIAAPLGAIIGVCIGHFVDTRFPRGSKSLPSGQEPTQAAFFTAAFSVMGYISKADGKVSYEEISRANSRAEIVMNELHLDNQQRGVAKDLFNQGKQSDFDVYPVLDQFRVECHRRTLLKMFLELQVEAAFADGHLDTAEHAVLKDIARHLGFQPDDLDRIVNLCQGTRTRGSRGSQTATEADAYKVLGVTPTTPLPEIKKVYKKLLSQHHPDKLVSKGLPKEMIGLANKRTDEIRKTWQDIQARHQP